MEQGEAWEASTDTKTAMEPPEISLQGFTSYPGRVKNNFFFSFLRKILFKAGKSGWMGGAGRAGDLGPLGWEAGAHPAADASLRYSGARVISDRQ